MKSKCFVVYLTLLIAVASLLINTVQASIVIISAQYGRCWITPSTHKYCVQNNVWGPDGGWVQTILVDDQTGAFTVDQSNHNKPTNGPPASYPSIYRGNHWGTATGNSGMPVQVSSLSFDTSWDVTAISSGIWNAAYDIWFHRTNTYSGGTPDGCELMIWINHLGNIQPAGSRVATSVSIAGQNWEVWAYSGTPNYIAYRITSKITSISFNIRDFTTDAVSRGYLNNAWYMVAVEAGFELWQGGAGLASNSFSVLPPPDIAVTNVTTSKTVVGQGYDMSIDVTVENQGETTETFNVTAYANTTAIEKQEITLTSVDSTTITFTWNTEGLTLGDYTLWAQAEPVPGETSTGDNISVYGVVTVVTPGDVNADRVVDVLDAAAVSAHWSGPPEGPLGYDANFDISYDGSINVLDSALVSAYWSGPPKGPLAP